MNGGRTTGGAGHEGPTFPVHSGSRTRGDSLMPLRALHDGVDIVGPDLDASAWVALKSLGRARRDALRLPCCDAVAIPRVSSRGLQHFAHKARSLTCDWQPETEGHMRAKLVIRDACRAAGWDGRLEAVAPDGAWRADVLAVRGRARIAFEVQLSPQDWEDTIARQARYAAAGVRGCWFIGRVRAPAWAGAPVGAVQQDAMVPAFSLCFDDEGAPWVLDGGGELYGTPREQPLVALSDYVSALLTGRVRFSPTIRATAPWEICAVFVPIRCWRCDAEAHVYFLADEGRATATPRSACGRELPLRDTWEAAIFHPAVVRAIEAYVGSAAGLPIRLGRIKLRHSQTVERSYLSFGCPNCDALFGSHYVRPLVMEAMMQAAIPEDWPVCRTHLPPIGDQAAAEWPHWCFPQHGRHCRSRRRR